MRMSKLLMPTLREVPAEAEITSHKLMLRAGLMFNEKTCGGRYIFLSSFGTAFLKKGRADSA